MNRIYRVIWNCTLQVFQACSELTRRVGKTSTVNLRKSSGLTTKFSRLTLGVLLALSGSASGASLEVDNDQITNIDTDVAYDAYLVGWYGTGVLNILWICPYISRHLLSLNPLQARCRRYSRGER
ncbi:ESPR-type extended signal peptide-containing protein [Escherichia coli]|nr:ESPR-type extended signal peptide-containing protein [Escherichia coli]